MGKGPPRAQRIAKFRVDLNQLDDVVVSLVLGLTTDGAHHKQYFLDQALRALCTTEWVRKAQEELGEWDRGIAP